MKRLLAWGAAWAVLTVVFSASAGLLMQKPPSGSTGPTFFNAADQGGGFTTPTTNYANDTTTNSIVGAWHTIRSNIASPAKTIGKWHFEIQVKAYDNGGGWVTGVTNNTSNLLNPIGYQTNSDVGLKMQGSGTSGNILGNFNGSQVGLWNFTFAVNDWLAIEVDLDNQKMWWQDATTGTGWSYAEPLDNFTGNPATNTGGMNLTGLITTGGMMIACSAYNQTPGNTPGADQCVLNPGVVTSGHAFMAAISSGFTAWDH